MRKITIIILAAALMAGCKGKSNKHWPDDERKAFTDNCVENGKAGMGEDKAKSYCNCMLDKMEAKYPDANAVKNMDMGSMMDMAKDCLK